MVHYRQKKTSWLKSIFDKPAGKAFASIMHLVHSHESDDETSDAIISLLKAVLWADGSADDQEIEYFKKILEDKYSAQQIAQLAAELKSPRKVNIETACESLKSFDEDKKISFLSSLVSLGLSNNNYSPKQREVVAKAAAELGVSKEELSKLENDIEQNVKAQSRLIKSSAGIIVALIVIGVFILTATLLKSVLFGLILAYVFLPLEKFYERKLEGNGLFSRFFQFFTRWGKTFKALSKSMRHKKDEPEYTDEELARRKRQALIAKASTLTVGSFIIIMIFVVTIFFSISANYLSSLGSSVKTWLHKHVKTEQISVVSEDGETAANTTTNSEIKSKEKNEPVVSGDKKTADNKEAVSLEKADTEGSAPASAEAKSTKVSYVKKVLINLEDLKYKLKEVPAIHWCIEQTSKILNDPQAQKEILTAALKKSGGVFSFATGIISSFISFLLNALLAIFFFSLFLTKMAEFINDDKNQQKMQSEYFIRTVFNSKWLPAATETTVSQAQEIISQVINKLRVWLRGYLTLITVDTIVYTTVFYLLGVPYAFLLGLIAAFGLLLPYIGPIASACLTVLVTLAVGTDVTMTQLLLIIGIYLIQNGIVEQLFLYPAVIGGSLGLTTLETIIVVLLGGIFAGITGMIFAIPTAAVLKYLIPKIYTCWK